MGRHALPWVHIILPFTKEPIVKYKCRHFACKFNYTLYWNACSLIAIGDVGYVLCQRKYYLDSFKYGLNGYLWRTCAFQFCYLVSLAKLYDSVSKNILSILNIKINNHCLSSVSWETDSEMVICTSIVYSKVLFGSMPIME